MDADRLAQAQAETVAPRGQAFAARISRLDGINTYAVVPSLSTTYEYGPVKFTGPESFEEGDPCLLVFDETGTPWIAANGPAPTDPAVVSVPQEGWHYVGAAGEPAFLNGWVNAGSGNVRFRKDPSGEVFIEGSTSNPTTTLVNSPIFTLPTGYRPATDRYQLVLQDNGTAGSYMLIKADGTVCGTKSTNGLYLQQSFPVDQTGFPAGAPAGALTKIGDFALSSSTNLTFSGIPQTYTHLKVYFTMQSNRTSNSPSANTGGRFRINGIATNYDIVIDGYHGVSNGSDGAYQGGQAWGYLGQIPNGLRASDIYVSKGTIDIPFYRDTSAKLMLAEAHMSDGVNYSARISVGNQYYGTPSAITQIDLMDDVNGPLGPRCAASLYGIP